MLSNDVWRQLEIGHARQAGMEEAKSSADSIFQQGVSVGATEQAIRSAKSAINDSKADTQNGGRWGVSSSLDGTLRKFRSEQSMRDYLSSEVSPTRMASGLFGSLSVYGSAKKAAAEKLTQTRAWLTSAPTKASTNAMPAWDEIFQRNEGNTVEAEIPGIGRVRGVRFESEKDPDVVHTLFNLKE